ncbi:MAG: methionine synthase [Roseovarius sp. BRH_c41]|nr:MAG: methionine synthase [Roseovarius sp. BRH_c41]
MLRLMFLVAALLALLAWALGYIWISGLACAFGAPSGACSIPMPWTLRGEDLMILVLMPGAVVAVLLGLACLSGWRAQNSDN